VKRIDERFVPYYWVKISHIAGGYEAGTDLEAIRDNAVSITPLQLDMTDYGMAKTLERSLGGLITADAVVSS
jgi:5'-nucleotidase